MTERLAPDDLADRLATLPDVHLGLPGQLVIRLEAPTFAAAITLVDLVAATAEELDHHPDIDVRWRSVTFGLSTHSVGGVSELDLELAARILEHAARVSARPLPPPGAQDAV